MKLHLIVPVFFLKPILDVRKALNKIYDQPLKISRDIFIQKVVDVEPVVECGVSGNRSEIKLVGEEHYFVD